METSLRGFLVLFPLIMITFESHFLMISINNLLTYFFLMLKDPTELSTETPYALGAGG